MVSENREQNLQDEYRLRFASAAEYRLDVWRVLCRSYFTRHIKVDDVVLDLGCGWGEFSNSIHARQKFAMDLNPDAGSRLKADVKFLHQDCSSQWPLEPNSLDIVFSSNFLEHLPSKQHIERTFVQAFRALRPGGKVILLGPNIRLVPGSYWDFWDHHVALTDRSLAELVQLAGFNVLERVERFLPYTMSEGRRAPLLLVKAYLRMPFVWRFFGKQFLVVGQKL